MVKALVFGQFEVFQFFVVNCLLIDHTVHVCSCKVRAQLSLDEWANAGAVAFSQIVGDLIFQASGYVFETV